MHQKARLAAIQRGIKIAFAVGVGISSLSHQAFAEDWTQWRGPKRDGISREKGLLQSWPAAGPTLLWQMSNVGLGYGTPAISGGKLFLQSNEGPQDEVLLALDANSGKTLWSQRIGNVGNPDQQPAYPGSRSTPTVEGTVLYALGSDGDLVCLETATGKPKWRKSLRGEFGGQPGIWAYSESPLIDGNTLVCTPGGAEATLLALDKRTGAVIWKSAVPGADQAAYSSVITVESGGVKQYVQFLQKGVVGVEAKTGKFLWRYDGTARNSPANIPTPVALGDYVYSASGRGGGGLVKLKTEQGALQAEQIYAGTKLPTSIGGAVLVGDYLYGTSAAGIMCVEFKTGEVKWLERGIGAGAVCFADGLLYVHGENGDVALVEATPVGYREKGRFSPPEPPTRGNIKAWAYPVVANGRLYVRELNKLWCYDVKAK